MLVRRLSCVDHEHFGKKQSTSLMMLEKKLRYFVAGVAVCIMPAVERPEQATLRSNVFSVDFLEHVLGHCDPKGSVALVLRFELYAIDIAAVNNFFQCSTDFLASCRRGQARHEKRTPSRRRNQRAGCTCPQRRLRPRPGPERSWL